MSLTAKCESFTFQTAVRFHFERRFRRTKRRYSEGERQKDVDQVLMINLFFFRFYVSFLINFIT